MVTLQAYRDIPLNADPLLAVDAMEVLHDGKPDQLTAFALQLHEIGAARFFSVGITTVNFLTIKGIEVRHDSPNEYLSEVIDYIKNNGLVFSELYAVDPHALNAEVSRYLSGTLMPVLNGVSNDISLDFPSDAPEHTRQYVLALVYVAYAFFVTAYKEITGESEVSFRELREQITLRTERIIGSIEKLLAVNPDIPQEPLDTSHFGDIHRSSFNSPTHEATASVDIGIPVRLAQYYGSNDKRAVNDLTDDVLSGGLPLDELIKPILHFCRAVLIIVFNMVDQDERDSYMTTANANITKSRKEGSITTRFGVTQQGLDVATQNILMALSSLMSNNGAFYEATLPDPVTPEYEDLVRSYITGMGMIADAYEVLITGRLDMSELEFRESLREILA